MTNEIKYGWYRELSPRGTAFLCLRKE